MVCEEIVGNRGGLETGNRETGNSCRYLCRSDHESAKEGSNRQISHAPDFGHEPEWSSKASLNISWKKLNLKWGGGIYNIKG